MNEDNLPKSCMDCEYHVVEGMLFDVCSKTHKLLCDDIPIDTQRDLECPLEKEINDESTFAANRKEKA